MSSLPLPQSVSDRALYDQDFYLWIHQTATALRARDFGQVDWENLIEEIESMGRSERKELKSRLIVLIEHLLKLLYWDAEKAQNARGWRSTIIEQRRQIRLILDDSPSLKPLLVELYPSAYQQAREDLLLQAEWPESAIPNHSEISLDNVLNPRYLPGHPSA